MINYFLLLDKNQTTDQKVVSSNPAGRAIKKTSKRRFFLWPKHSHLGLQYRLLLISQNLWDKYAIKICFFVNCDIDLL